MDEISGLCEERNQLILQLKTELKDQKRLMKDRLMEERRNLETHYNQTSGLLQEENDTYKATLSDLNSSISTLEEEKQEKEAENSILQLKLQKISMQYNALNDEMQREKDIWQSQSKAQKLALESQYHDQIMNLKKQIAQSKRDLIAQIGLEFCSIFDVKSQINETNFEMFIRNIKKQLVSLLDQDHKIRSLLSLGPKQSIADAVELLMLNIKKK